MILRLWSKLSFTANKSLLMDCVSTKRSVKANNRHGAENSWILFMISIKDARKILETPYSDDQIKEIIQTMIMLAKLQIKTEQYKINKAHEK